MRFFSSLLYSGWVRKTYKSLLSLIITDMALKGASVVVLIIIARAFGPSIYGRYSTAAATASLFLMITGLGFEQEFTRSGGKNQQDISMNFMLTLTSLGIASLVAFLGMTLFFSGGFYLPETVTLGLFLMAALIVNRFHLPFRSLCLLLDQTHTTALIQSLSTVLIFFLTLWVIFLDGTLLHIVLLQLFVGFITLLMWFWWIPKQYLTARLTVKDLGHFLRRSIPFAFSNLIWVAYFSFDTFILSLFRSESEVGIYSGAYRLVALVYIIGYATSNTFTPLLFEHYGRDKQQYGAAMRQLITTIGVAGILLSIGQYLLAGITVPAIIGNQYMPAVLIVKVLSLGTLFRMLNYGLTEVLTTSDRQSMRVCLEVTMLTVNILLNLLLIPIYGGVGAAVATVVAEFVLFFGCLIIFLNSELALFFVMKSEQQPL